MKPPSITSLVIFLLIALSVIALGQNKREPADPVARKYKPELDRIKADYETRLKAVQTRMITDYDSAIKSSLAAKDLDAANALKSKMEALRDKTSIDLRIVGRWTIVHGTKTDVWTINKDYTYNYGSDTGKWSCNNGKFLLDHTWDRELRLMDENTYEGVCVRGQTGTRLKELGSSHESRQRRVWHLSCRRRFKLAVA